MRPSFNASAPRPMIFIVFTATFYERLLLTGEKPHMPLLEKHKLSRYLPFYVLWIVGRSGIREFNLESAKAP